MGESPIVFQGCQGHQIELWGDRRHLVGEARTNDFFYALHVHVSSRLSDIFHFMCVCDVS